MDEALEEISGFGALGAPPLPWAPFRRGRAVDITLFEHGSVARPPRLSRVVGQLATPAVATNEDGHPTYAALDPVPSFSTQAITAWAEARLAPNTDVISDGLVCFRAVVDLDHAHTVIACKDPRTRCEINGAKWVNKALSNVKRALDGTYHWFSFFKYSHRYLGEAARRFNRRFDLSVLVDRMLHAAAACSLCSERALRAVPMFRPA